MKAFFIFAALTLAGCSHDIKITGQGNVISATGDRDCYGVNAPCEVTAIHDYTEVYTAVPAGGWAFDRWENCPTAVGNVCPVDVSPNVLRELWGTDLDFALTAKFYKAATIGEHGEFGLRYTVDGVPWDWRGLYGYGGLDYLYTYVYAHVGTGGDWAYCCERTVARYEETETGFIVTTDDGWVFMVDRGNYTVIFYDELGMTDAVHTGVLE